MQMDGAHHQIAVSSPSVSRGGLAATWALTARRHDGEPLGPELEIALDESYLSIFDRHAVDPNPAESWTQPGTVYWRFELSADVVEFNVILDARIQPGSRWRHRGSTTVGIGDESITARSTTWLVP